MSLDQDLLNLQIAAQSFAAEKTKLTGLLTAYVNQFNKVTDASNTLRAVVDTTVTDGTPAVQNLSTAEAAAIATNPMGYYATAVSILINMLICLSQDQAHTLIAGVNDILTKNVDQFFADVAVGKPPVQTTPDRVVLPVGIDLNALKAALTTFNS